jgi:hypothetical protein
MPANGMEYLSSSRGLTRHNSRTERSTGKRGVPQSREDSDRVAMKPTQEIYSPQNKPAPVGKNVVQDRDTKGSARQEQEGLRITW